jgi:transcriptional regulator GlxA family with amidase domain
MSTRTRHVVVVAFPGVQPLDAVGPIEVFAGATRTARSLGLGAAYRVTLASTDGQPVEGESGIALCTLPLPDPGEPIDTLVIAGGNGTRTARHDPQLISWIQTVAPTCRRVTTVCTGTFVAAEAGLLAGRRVTTHWASAARLEAEFPDITVDPDPIYIKDGKYWTSAGVTAGIDLALALVQEDLGVDVSQTVARWLVMFLHRPGGQTQFASPVWVRRAERSTVRAVQALVEAAPGGDHRVPVLAAAAAMSLRHFTRVFSTEVG